MRTVTIAVCPTDGQRDRLFGLLVAAGDVRSCVIDHARLRLQRGDWPVTSYAGLCRLMAESGPGTFGDLDSAGARSVLRAWSSQVAEARKRKLAGVVAHWPWRKRRLVPVSWYSGRFEISQRNDHGGYVRIPTAGRKPLWVRWRGRPPYDLTTARSIRLQHAGGGKLELAVSFDVAVVAPHADCPHRVAGNDLGEIHPYAIASGVDGLIVSGRAMRAEHYLHHLDTKKRRRTTAARAPSKGQRGSRRWRKTRARARVIEGRHARRIGQARHEAAKAVITWANEHQVTHLVVGDPTGVLNKDAGKRHNRRLRQWAPGRLIDLVEHKAEVAGIDVEVVDERGTSSTCPACDRRVPKPRGRNFSCPHCGLSSHRDLVGAANIARRGTRANTSSPTAPSSNSTSSPTISSPSTTPMAAVPTVVTHRRAGKHLPGVTSARRDPRRPTTQVDVAGSTWPVEVRPTSPAIGGGGSRSVP